MINAIDKLCTLCLEGASLKASSKVKNYLVVQNVNKILDDKMIRRALHDPNIRDNCPRKLQDILDRTRVAMSLNPPLGQSISSFTQASLSIDTTTPNQNDNCPCKSMFPDDPNIKWFDGHACGQAHLLPIEESIKFLFLQGRKYRPSMPTADIEDAVFSGVHRFVCKYMDPAQHNQDFCALDVQRLESALCKAIMDRVQLTTFNDAPELSHDLRAKLKKLQDTFVILNVDKSSHDFGFICKHKYQSALVSRLTDGDCFTRVLDPPAVVLQRICTTTRTLNLPGPPTFPYLYSTLKLHKSTPKFRYISGVSKKNVVSGLTDSQSTDYMNFSASVLTNAQSDLCGCLKSILNGLQVIDNDQAKSTGIRMFWVIQSSDTAALFLKKHARIVSGLHMRTYDFTTMYDKLEHSDIQTELHHAIDEVFDFYGDGSSLVRDKSTKKPTCTAKQRGFHFKATTDASTKATHTIYTKQDVKFLVTFCLNNAFILQGDTLFQQIRGIPMGANASPDMANIFCHMKEKSYMQDLVNRGDIDMARRLSFTLRYIDDILCFGCTPPPSDVYRMEYSCTNLAPGDTVYLGMRIRQEQDVDSKECYLRLAVYDKSRMFPFTPLTFPPVYSTAPASFASSILIGACVRSCRICNNIFDLKRELTNVCAKLIARNHPLKILKRGFHKFVSDYFPEERFQNIVNILRGHFFWVINKLHKATHVTKDTSCLTDMLKDKTSIRFRGPFKHELGVFCASNSVVIRPVHHSSLTQHDGDTDMISSLSDTTMVDTTPEVHSPPTPTPVQVITVPPPPPAPPILTAPRPPPPPPTLTATPPPPPPPPPNPPPPPPPPPPLLIDDATSTSQQDLQEEPPLSIPPPSMFCPFCKAHMSKAKRLFNKRTLAAHTRLCGINPKNKKQGKSITSPSVSTKNTRRNGLKRCKTSSVPISFFKKLFDTSSNADILSTLRTVCNPTTKQLRGSHRTRYLVRLLLSDNAPQQDKNNKKKRILTNTVNNNKKKKLQLPGILKKVYQNTARVEDGRKPSVPSSALSSRCHGISKRLLAFTALTCDKKRIMDADVAVGTKVPPVMYTNADNPLDENTVDSPSFPSNPP